jgi:glycosyltransferase involved in cell wall biosynthesis
MRVLLISNYAWTVFNFRRRLIKDLQDHGHELYVQTQFDGYEKRLGLSDERVFSLQIDRKGMNPWRDAQTVLSIVRCIRRVNADVCLLFTIKPVIYGGIAARFLSRPFICNITGLGTAFLGSRWLRRLAQAMFRLSLKRAERVFFQNEDDRSAFVDGGIVPARIASVLPGSGVDTTHFSLMSPTGNIAPVFLMISRLLRDKGVVEFVEAARIVKKRLPLVKFQLLGPLNIVNRTAITHDDVQAWVNEGTIEYLGETDDVRPFLSSADCVVLPSYREGTPRSLLEASAVGRPIVAANVPGCRSVVEDGQTGVLCQAKSSLDLAEKMETIARMPESKRREMGQKGRVKMEREFDEKIVLRHYALAIQALACTPAAFGAQDT